MAEVKGTHNRRRAVPVSNDLKTSGFICENDFSNGFTYRVSCKVNPLQNQYPFL